MDKNKEIDNAIKEALTLGEDNIEINMASLNEVKNRLRVREGWYSINMKRFSEFLRFGVRRRAAVTCALMLVAGISVSTIEPARTFAAQNIEKVKNVVYDVVKDGNGKYTAVKVPNKETKVASPKEFPTFEPGKSVGNQSKLPTVLEGGYKLYQQGTIAIDPKTNYSVVADGRGEYAITAKLPDGWKGGISNFYRNGSSVIVAIEEGCDTPFVSDINGKAIKGDNEKSFKIGNQDVVYAEYPDARYPYVNDNEDRTQKPTILVSHTIKWNQDGRYYIVYDFNGDLSLDTLKLAAESIIDSLNN